MGLITEPYRALNAQMHQQGQFRGSNVSKHLDAIREYAALIGATSILDYGCGPARLNLPNVWNYDPCVSAYSADPPPCDLVVCLDVLEHVEPGCLDDVMAHIRSKARIGAYLNIALRPDREKTLPDGTNPHKTVRTAQWWRDKLEVHFERVYKAHHKAGHHVTLDCW